MIDAGQPAPAFSLPAHTGGDISLASLKGQPVVLYFYPKDDTPGCTKEACSFRDNWETLRNKGVAVLGVSPDGVEKHVWKKPKTEIHAEEVLAKL